ncbi:FCD domain-containing protein [Microbacterium oxydans]|uniref:FCD domain-containing protein n=1 Tax=Microbacterium oxydans TaxID=82380 RepID=UPI00142D230A
MAGKARQRVLSGIQRVLETRVVVRRASWPSCRPSEQRTALEEHARALDAIWDGDRERAEAARHYHILEGWERRRPSTERKP